ncbi:DHS-like NAD/FAD-binding domain-containing protein [Trametes punicea]|nr:DHS-like NAD/FAD-binding domain-containing protein [Trametes punicea]
MDDPDELLMLYDGPTKVLESRDIAGIAKYMQSERCRRVVVLVTLIRASAAAGVPDFRSPKKGEGNLVLRSTMMARLNLPYPKALFELTYFRFNPVPLYTLARELCPGRYRPTLTHSFVRLLADRSSLHICFTENIDALERQAGVPLDRLLEAQGSVATQSCIDCQAEYDSAKMKDAMEKGEVARCESCGGVVKPGFAFHGDPPSHRFIEKSQELNSTDLLFVIGTTLTAQPLASLATMVPQNCPRVLINMDFADDFGMRSDDVLLLGKCDDIVRELCKELGWEEALDQAWARTEIQLLASQASQTNGRDGAEHGRTVHSSSGLDGSPEDETMALDDTNEFGVMADVGWQDKEVKADSLTERLRTALEQSEKPSSHVSDPGITFVARSLSGEELFADASTDYSTRQAEVPMTDGSSRSAAEYR